MAGWRGGRGGRRPVRRRGRRGREESTQTEEEEERREEEKSREVARRRRESRDLALSLAQQELMELVARLEEAKATSEQQVAEIRVLSRTVDLLHLQQSRSRETRLSLTSGQQGNFIIKDLQSQVLFVCFVYSRNVSISGIRYCTVLQSQVL